jgi:hypothetical protein
MLDRVGTDHTSSNTIFKIIRRQWIYNFLFNKPYSNHQASKVITTFNIDQKKDVCYTIYYLGIQGSFHDTLPNDNHGLPMYQLHIMRHYHVVHVILVLPSWFTRPLANQGGRWHSYKMTWPYHLSFPFHLLSHKLALIEIKSESSSVIRCNQEGGHCHLTNPLSLQAGSSLAQGGFPGLRLLGLGGMKFKVM